MAKGTLSNWRSRGKGPPFQKFGSRVRYPLEDLVKWEADNRHAPTASNDNEDKGAANAA